VHEVTVEAQRDSSAGPGEADQVRGSGDVDGAVLADRPLDLDRLVCAQHRCAVDPAQSGLGRCWPGRPGSAHPQVAKVFGTKSGGDGAAPGVHRR
jgi:hypothetical protein